jgi:hypothetical protein
VRRAVSRVSAVARDGSLLSRAVLHADPCAYCLDTGGTIDHIEPRKHGGLNSTNNRVGACERCNNLKGAMPSLLFLVKFGFPVRPNPYRRYRLSVRRRARIRAAFRRLDEVERTIFGLSLPAGVDGRLESESRLTRAVDEWPASTGRTNGRHRHSTR